MTAARRRSRAWCGLVLAAVVAFGGTPAAAGGCPRETLLDKVDEAMALAEKGASGQGREALERLDDCHERYSEYWFYRGLLDYSDARANERDGDAMVKRIDRAARDMRHAMDIEPGRIAYWRGYALIMSELRRDREAADYFRKYFAAPDDALGPRPLGMLKPYVVSLVRLGEFDRALKVTRLQRARFTATVSSCDADLTYVWNVYDGLLRRNAIRETEASNRFFNNACLDG